MLIHHLAFSLAIITAIIITVSLKSTDDGGNKLLA